MHHKFFQMALVVDDYDKAIAYYTKVLSFELIEDTPLTPEKRWVVVRPRQEGSCQILLAKAKNEEQKKFIGNQAGGRVFLFLHTDNLDADYQHLRKHQVNIVRDPVEEPFGKVLVFSDMYGNLWDLIQPRRVL